MDRPIIRRLARIDGNHQHLLLSITQTGSSLLDLKLVATDHEHLYHGALLDNAIKSLQASNFDGPLNEWKSILSHSLLQTRPEDISPDQYSGVEAVASISKSIVTITIRKKVGSITQRLGEIKLNEDDEREEVAAFEWVDAAVATSDDLRRQLESLQTSVTQQQEEVAKLSAQLDELVKAKKTHEEGLLRKFAALLNAKKSKIRDQQHLLSRAQIDPAVAQEVQTSRASATQSRKPRRQPGESGTNKRKAREEIVPASDEDMDDATGDQDLADDVDSDEERQIESGEDEDATEDEDEFEASTSIRANNPPAPSTDANTSGQSQGDTAVQRSIEPLPPRRGLPFRRKSEQETSTRGGDGDGDGDDDDETEDEL
ncbi:uncharacterized protein K489DRAFT_375437 [Dissoconium aciculare CBS 342.82]|uniref:XRCC4 coiled-coil domain-containing protein n=1 Tax=Dissoconium aciculare CBS 342.82 TaxID=1314786 RepID=A0A6J3MHI8_9PEZI|nr:uncharacterized protein K489DRAFT_375437 [Dissoconium aciculare CBS 342.82]KAF1827348.1 hypothetical protein K489DRAFT_375437 [Dissoconium aciculare CBS 342.82]